MAARQATGWHVNYIAVVGTVMALAWGGRPVRGANRDKDVVAHVRPSHFTGRMNVRMPMHTCTQ